MLYSHLVSMAHGVRRRSLSLVCRMLIVEHLSENISFCFHFTPTVFMNFFAFVSLPTHTFAESAFLLGYAYFRSTESSKRVTTIVYSLPTTRNSSNSAHTCHSNGRVMLRKSNETKTTLENYGFWKLLVMVLFRNLLTQCLCLCQSL